MSKEVRTFCHGEGIEILTSPVNDHRATGCVERTIGSIKNSVLTYAREEKPEPLDRMVERALGALTFAKNATLNITRFEARHGREANTVLRNLTKKPSLRNLNWENVIRSKSTCLDERDPNAQAMPEPMDTNWGVRSDTEYDVKNRRHHSRLADDRIANQDNEPGIVRTTDEPASIPPVVVMQRTGERNLNRYKPLKSTIINRSEHTIKMSNGAVLRKSGVALKRTNIAKKRAPGQIAAPPTPWDLKRKLLANQPCSSKGTTGTHQSTVGKRKKPQIRDNVEDSESGEDDYLPLATTRQAIEPKEGNPGANFEGARQETSSGGQQQTETITIRPSDYETATEYTIAREAEIETNRRKNDTTDETPKETEREIPQIGKSGAGNNGLFRIRAEIRQVR